MGRRHLSGESLESRWAVGALTAGSVLLVEEGYVKMFLRGRPVTMYMPRDQVESYNLEAKVDLPTKRLKLEWVYPLSAAQCSGPGA